MARISAEAFGLGLLTDHGSERFGADTICEINQKDSPDLEATLPSGDRWGVEVTRGYLRVGRLRTGERVPTAADDANLEPLTRELDRKASDARRLGCFLVLCPEAWTPPGRRRPLVMTNGRRA